MRSSAPCFRLGSFRYFAHRRDLGSIDRAIEFVRAVHGDLEGMGLFQSAEAIPSGSIPNRRHQAVSLLARCNSRWCARHSGTVNSSPTFWPSPRTCAKRRWWGSQARGHSPEATTIAERAPRAAPANASLCLRSPQQLVLPPVASKSRSAHRRADKKRRTNPLQTRYPLPRSSKNLSLWTDTS